MKSMARALGTLVLLASAACAVPPQTPANATSTGAAAVARVAPATLAARAAEPTVGGPADETAVKQLVEHFGKRLQSVSLLAPDAAQEMQQQYAEFVSPSLLQTWMRDVSSAPGRLVSSPWPDHIEITTIEKEAADQYVITGFVVEVTSVEVVNGGAAARIPVRIVVGQVDGDWRITEYTQER